MSPFFKIIIFALIDGWVLTKLDDHLNAQKQKDSKSI